MPLEVRISINERPIETFRIGRLEGGTDPDDINTYAIVEGEEFPVSTIWWKAPRVKHRYGNGATTLVAKALGAIIDGRMKL